MHIAGVCWTTLTLCLHDTARSGFGSPPSPSLLRANPPTQHDSLFAFGSNQQQQYQPTQAPPPGFGGMRGSGGASQGGHQSKGGLPLGSGRGLETMPEDDDTMVGLCLVCLLQQVCIATKKGYAVLVSLEPPDRSESSPTLFVRKRNLWSYITPAFLQACVAESLSRLSTPL